MFGLPLAESVRFHLGEIYGFRWVWGVDRGGWGLGFRFWGLGSLGLGCKVFGFGFQGLGV